MAPAGQPIPGAGWRRCCANFRLLAPDLPGHGFTSARRTPDPSLPGMARALTALLAKLDFAPRLAIGHSAGAAILARLIAEGKIKPELFVAINGAFLPFEGFAARLFPLVARLLRFNPLAARMFSAMSDRASVANMLAGMGTRLDARGLDLYARLMKSPAHCAGALDMMANWDLWRCRRPRPPALPDAPRGRREGWRGAARRRRPDRPAAEAGGDRQTAGPRPSRA